MSAAPEPLKPLKTWSHLAERRKRPSEYDIVTTRLHYRRRDPAVPWELDPDLPMNDWYRKYCNESPLRHPDWDTFQDPDQLVYRTYNIMQDGQEAYVGGLLDQFSDRGHDQMISREWIATLAAFYTPARYLYHGLQMASSYVAQMAPASTITTCAIFQTADSLRWVTHTAYRTVELSKACPDLGLGTRERELWENAPQWQGFRRLLEESLTVWDWAEAFAVLNLVLKPAVEETLLRTLADTAGANSDTLYSLLSQAQMRDAERHRRWASRLVDMALTVEDNRGWLRERIDAWTPRAEQAIETYCNALPESDNGDAATARVARFQQTLGLRG
ncbi:toluene monooxygenase [Oleomonas cavernae]|uniref:Toluene monooxygenase n=1 Tax=Oleomonas cavernae TaxID=2320859 RepID=A0A418WJF1_9PROT|nr:aromatic/alkene monooxygenase hydroxylase subunit beta [Oleomonas cavernae]RJF90090.1 toluene monooxygenase [Oleomonas cavernae]